MVKRGLTIGRAMNFRVELFSARERRAAIAILAAALVLAVAGAAYLQPAHRASAMAARPVVTPRPPAPEVLTLAIGARGRLYIVAGDRNSFTSGRRLYASADGGRSWRPLPLPAAAGSAVTVGAVRDAPAVVVTTVRPAAGTGYEPDAWRSPDGGATWSRLEAPAGGTPGGGQFQDTRHGTWSTRQRDVFRAWTTADGGSTWRLAVEVAPGGTFGGRAVPASSSFQFAAAPDGTAWLVIMATGGPVATPSVLPPPRLLRSSDGGATWTETPLTLPTGIEDAWVTLGAPVVGADGRGQLAARAYRVQGTGGAVAQLGTWTSTTRDGGTTWSAFAPDAHPGSAVAPDGTWWSAVGGQLAKSSDLGATWSVTVPRLPPGTSLGRLEFVSAREAWSLYSLYEGARPDRGYLLHTTDGGATWTQVLGPAR